MWPFTREKPTEAVEEDLAPEVQQFFRDNNPEKNHASIFERTPHQQRVNEVMLRHSGYSQELEEYKRQYPLKQAVQINCAELQEAVAACFRDWKVFATDPCRCEVDRAKKGAEVTTDGLKRLHYDECVLVKQCEAIRFLVDKAFVNNFGQFGDDELEQALARFNAELDSAFYKVWK